MGRRETSINLPPPRPAKKNSQNNILWILITCFALAGGAAGGVWVGKKNSRSKAKQIATTPSPAIERALAEARDAISNGHWKKAGELYKSVLEKQPENAEAKASLPLIRKRLQESSGNLVVISEPVGAKVTVPGREAVVTPAAIEKLPTGEMKLRIEMEGFEPVVKTVDIDESQTTRLEIALEKSAGRLELVSEPRGAEYKIIKSPEKNTDDFGELVQVGKTPAKVEDLQSGEYEVHMSVKGWPDYSQKIKVEHNRSAAVSAVFARGGINIVSDPVGVEVWALIGDGPLTKRGITPLTLSDLPTGRHQIEVRYRNWAPIKRTVEVKGSVTQNLEFGWERSIVTFTSDPEGASVYHDKRRLGSGVSVTPFNLEIPEGDYLFEARYNGLQSVAKGVYIDGPQSNQINFPFNFGSVFIVSEPAGATVVANGLPIGRTPLNRTNVPPGQHSYTVSKDKYKPVTLSGVVQTGSQLDLAAKLESDKAANINRNFTSGVGQKMIWFDSLGGWVADTEVLQSVYELVAKNNPSDIKNPKHPVDSVSWYQANQFCNHLTAFESSLGRMPPGFVYRLPTDAEWSGFAGKTSLSNAITSANTRYRSSQPAGSAAPNNYGLYDIRGNLTEWVQDWYSQQILNLAQKEGARVRQEWVGTDRKVLRGGSWLRSTKSDLEIPYRRGGRPSSTDGNDVGFRVVLMPQ